MACKGNFNGAVIRHTVCIVPASCTQRCFSVHSISSVVVHTRIIHVFVFGVDCGVLNTKGGRYSEGMLWLACSGNYDSQAGGSCVSVACTVHIKRQWNHVDYLSIKIFVKYEYVNNAKEYIAFIINLKFSILLCNFETQGKPLEFH